MTFTTKLNKTYNPSGISFKTDEKYELSYLKRIKSYLENEIAIIKPKFVYGKGKIKTELQRFYEAIDEYITKLTE